MVGLVVQYIVFFVMRVIGVIFESLPCRQGYWFLGQVGLLIYFADRKHRKIAIDNLSKCFPNKPLSWRIDVVKKVYQHFSKLYGDLLFFLRKVRKYNYSNYIAVENLSLVDEFIKSYQKVVLVTAHFGNWEVAGNLISMLGYKIASVARHQKNIFLDSFFEKFRTAFGQEIIYKKDALKLIFQAVKVNKIVALVVDQNAGRHGILVPFFGQPASTIFSHAFICLKENIPLLGCFCYRISNDFKFKMVFVNIYTPKSLPHGKKALIYKITEKTNSVIEDFIRARPEQWLWLHRRWKLNKIFHKPNKCL